MKIIINCLLFVVVMIPNLSFSQAKKPTIMIVPADVWMNERGFIVKHDNQGKVFTEMDYEKAFLESSDLKIVINKLQQMMNSRSFPTKDLEQSLKTLKNESAEDELLSSKNGGDVNETAIDKIRKVAKADIIMEVYWKVNTQGPKKSISFTLRGIDAYTNKPIANAGGTGEQSVQPDLAILLEEAIITNIDPFNTQLQTFFDDILTNGREIIVRIKTFSSWDGDLETEFEGNELNSLIESWISNNTVKNRFSLTDATENFMLFEQVRIPLYDVNSKAIDGRGWLRTLQKELKEKYQVTSKLMTKGLGEAILVIGDK
jgi:hypothetical protein